MRKWERREAERKKKKEGSEIRQRFRGRKGEQEREGRRKKTHNKQMLLTMAVIPSRLENAKTES